MNNGANFVKLVSVNSGAHFVLEKMRPLIHVFTLYNMKAKFQLELYFIGS